MRASLLVRNVVFAVLVAVPMASAGLLSGMAPVPVVKDQAEASKAVADAMAADGGPLAPGALDDAVADASRLGAASGIRISGVAPWEALRVRDDDAPPPIQEFKCPTSDPLQQPPNADVLDRTALGCPIRVYDTTNHFGNAQVDVDPGNEANAAFCGLHGPGSTDGPTPRARSSDAQTHVTFTTNTQGLSWSDQPTTPGAGGFGESADCVFDKDGNLYVAYLSNTAAYEPGVYGSTITLYKSAGTEDDNAVSRAYGDAATLRGRSGTNPISDLSLLYLRQHNEPKLVNGTSNATLVRPGEEVDVGHYTVEENHTLDRVLVTWFERASDWRNSTTGYSGWIDAAVTDLSSRNRWTGLRFVAPTKDDSGVHASPESQLIGPCMDASNSVYYRGKAYIACVVDAGYQARSRARIGDIDIWEIDPVTRNTTYIDTTGIRGGQPRLAASPDGRFVLTTSEYKSPTETRVDAAWGWYAKHWERQGNLGGSLHTLLKNVPALQSAVTALAISEEDHTAVLVYMEHQNVTEQAPPGIDPTNPPPLPDPNNLQDTIPNLVGYRKVLVTFNACTFPIAASTMQLGTGVDPENADAYIETPDMFEDENDGLQYYVEPNGGELFYFAVNDFGAMQFGAVIVRAPVSPCNPPPPAINFQAAVLPQALTVPQTASLALGSIAAVSAAAIAAYLLAVKRKSPQFTAAEDK